MILKNSHQKVQQKLNLLLMKLRKFNDQSLLLLESLKNDFSRLNCPLWLIVLRSNRISSKNNRLSRIKSYFNFSNRFLIESKKILCNDTHSKPSNSSFQNWLQKAEFRQLIGIRPKNRKILFLIKNSKSNSMKCFESINMSERKFLILCF